MSDNLWDRICAAIEEERNKWAGNDAAPETLADAVIRELGRYEYAIATADMEFIYMHVDERSELDDMKLYPGEQIVRRHVTEWAAEDQPRPYGTNS